MLTLVQCQCFQNLNLELMSYGCLLPASSLTRPTILAGLVPLTNGQYGIFEHRGHVWCSMPTSKERLDAASAFEDFREDDVVVLTYPKAGN